MNKISILLKLVLTISFGILVWLLPSKVVAKPIQVWQLMGKTVVDRTIKILVDEKNDRFRIIRSTGSVLLVPPFKKKLGLNPETKLYFPARIVGIGPTFVSYYYRGQVRKTGISKLLGFKVQKFKFKSQFCKDRSPNYLADFYTTKALGVSEQLSNAMCTIMGAPTNLGFPLRYTVSEIRNQNKKTLVFAIDSIKKVKVDESSLRVPRNYKRATSYAAFIFSQDGDLDSSELDDFFRTKIK